MRVFSDTEAEVASPSISIYNVGYRLFAHLIRKDSWERYPGITGLERLDRNYQHDIRPAQRRFDAVVLPHVATFLDSETMRPVRIAALATRLAFNIDATHRPAREKLQSLIAELQAALTRVTETLQRDRQHIAQLHAELVATQPPIAS